MRRWVAFAPMLLLAGCALTQDAERRRADDIQELRDLRTQLAAATEEMNIRRESETRALDQLRSAFEELRRERARSVDLASRLKTCQTRESALGADQDVCQKMRKAAEDEVQAARSELVAVEGERTRWREEIEACRGRVADLEAQEAVLTTALSREEREMGEKIEEITRLYGGLLGETRAEVETCQGQLSEARDEAGRLAAERDTADAPRRRRCERLDRLAATLASRWSGVGGAHVLRSADRVRLILPTEALFLPGSTLLSPSGAELLAPISEDLAGAEGVWLAVADRSEAAGYAGGRDELFRSAWEFSAARAAAVARALREGGGPRVEPLAVALRDFWQAGDGAFEPDPVPGMEIQILPVPIPVCAAPTRDLSSTVSPP